MKKIISLISALAILMSVCGLYSFAADKKIKSLKIVSQPVKTVFYKDTDWVYGTWDASEGSSKDVTLKSSKKISFTHNPCGGIYPERGMIDMTGLIELIRKLNLLILQDIFILELLLVLVLL